MRQFYFIVFATAIVIQSLLFSNGYSQDSIITNVKSGIPTMRVFQLKRQLTQQQQKIDRLLSFADSVSENYSMGLDTAQIYQKIATIEAQYHLAKVGLFEKGSLPSVRNLTTSELLLKEMYVTLSSDREKVLSYQRRIQNIEIEFDSLAADTSIYKIPIELSDYPKFSDRLQKVQADIRPIDSILFFTSGELVNVRSRVDKLLDSIQHTILQIEGKRAQLTEHLLEAETPWIWVPDFRFGNLQVLMPISIGKAKNMLMYFYKNNKFLLGFSAFIAFLLYVWLFLARRNIRKNAVQPAQLKDNLVYIFPLASSLFIVINFLQFLFLFPPFAFQSVVFIACSILITILLLQTPKSDERSYVFQLIVLSVPLVLLNLLVQPFSYERQVIFLFAVVGLWWSIRISRNFKHKMQDRKHAIFLLHLFMLCQVIALVAIISGRFNISKTFLTGGYYTFISGLYLLYTEMLIFQLLEITVIAFNQQKHSILYTRIQKISSFTKSSLHFWIYVGVAVVFLRSFYSFNVLLEDGWEFLSTERSVGKYSFSFDGILLFILIIFISNLLSRFIAFIFDDANFKTSDERGKGGLKNWIIIMKLIIMTFGIIVAFAASGIQMDRLAIILGSLGVGIGFGMQTLVNNVVSGVMIAFERPIEVGDQIEVNGLLGKVKEIGLRGSKVEHLDGSEVVIPNGDLLNMQVINWTASNAHRRLDVLVGVAYGTNLTEAIQLLEVELSKIDLVRKHPAPLVIVNQFADSAIEIRILFWVDVADFFAAKSAVLLAIDQLFREHGIQIPFPQRVLHSQ